MSVWLSVNALDQRSYSTPRPVNAWMGDRLRTGKPRRRRTRRPGLLSMGHLSVGKRRRRRTTSSSSYDVVVVVLQRRRRRTTSSLSYDVVVVVLRRRRLTTTSSSHDVVVVVHHHHHQDSHNYYFSSKSTNPGNVLEALPEMRLHGSRILRLRQYLKKFIV